MAVSLLNLGGQPSPHWPSSAPYILLEVGNALLPGQLLLPHHHLPPCSRISSPFVKVAHPCQQAPLNTLDKPTRQNPPIGAGNKGGGPRGDWLASSASHMQRTCLCQPTHQLVKVLTPLSKAAHH